MRTSSALAALPRAVFMLLLSTGIALIFAEARRVGSDRELYSQALREVTVIPPDTVPPLTQESIDLALVMFGIDVPTGALHPVLDKDLNDRGLTVRGALFEQAKVSIGPSAFANWALLGSTLAHELEVHCRQSFFFISMMDSVGLDGTVEAERQAYLHELKNARRFGLNEVDSQLINDTMAFFYPDSGRDLRLQLSTSVRRWLALNLIQTHRDL